MGAREERLGKNEAVFREVNERIRDVSAAPAEAEFLCECADATCTAAVAMSLVEYELVRGDPLHFLVLPGHELEDVEDVVDRGDGFTVVRKRDGAAQVAAATDPRS
jgi:hypothetical protein